MPEGDTIHQAAQRLRPALVDAVILAFDGSHRTVAANRTRLIGRRIDAVEAHGKHLLIHLERGWTIRSHMGMTGRWRLYGPNEPWRTTAGKARIVIDTGDAVAVCFSAPHVEIAPTDQLMHRLGRIGPDLISDDAAHHEIAVRAAASGAPTMADLLLDQSIASGIGNVYKSETLFLEGVSPHDPPQIVGEEAIERVYRRASRLLRVNVGPGVRSTTGTRRPREQHWVYERAGLPCRRCNTLIESARHGDLDRSTYWCPTCQAPTSEPAPS